MSIIGFDAKRAYANNTGLGNYARAHLLMLMQYCPDIGQVHYTTDNRLGWRMPSAVALVSPPAWLPAPLRSGWRRYAIGPRLRRDCVQLFHGLSHEIPAHTGGVPTLVTMHDALFLQQPAWYTGVDRAIYTRKWRDALRHADAVVAISLETKRVLEAHFPQINAPVQVVYQPVRQVFAQPVEADVLRGVCQRYRLPQNFVLYVGALNARKNLLTVLKALEIATDIQLVIAGAGKRHEPELRRFVAEKGLNNRVHFLGYVPDADLPALYRMAAVCVYPSVAEGFGLPIVEALLSGTPVVSSAGSCFAEAGGPGTQYCPPFQPEAFADTLQNVLTDSALQEKMRTTGLAWAAQFDPAVIARQWAGLYGQMAIP